MTGVLDDPRWLLALPLVPLVVVLGLRGQGARAAVWLRAVAVALVVLALAGPRVGLPGSGVDVAFLVDASDSVGPEGHQAALDWVEAAVAARGDDDRAALALFGRDARLEHPLRSDPPPPAPSVVVDGSASDLAAAARLGQGLLGGERRRRAVLLTDGRPTAGDLDAVAAQLAEAGVTLDVVPLPGAGAADLLVEEVSAPNRVREGEAYTLDALLANTGGAAAQAVVVTTADGEEVDRRSVTLPPGRTTVTLDAEAGEPGTVRYEVTLQAADSGQVENDVGRAAVQVAGPPNVLVLEGIAEAGRELGGALEAGGVGVERRAVGDGGLPPLDQLLDHDGIVLVDVPASALGEAGMTTLATYVREAGRGLVAVGGERSFGPGGYQGTPLEDVLPVFAQVTDPTRRPTVAEALVVDTSGSMAACHCADEGAFGGPVPESSGVVKTDIAKEAIVRAVDALQSQDVVGVLAFNERHDWVVPLQALPDHAVVDEALARIHPDGGTSIAPAVRAAIEGLRDTDARLRHIVLFTDGFDPNETGLVEVADEARDEGMTLSVIATGEGPMGTLEEMAEAGGGRFYPGRDLLSIPDIIALEVEFAARPLINEGRFFPIVAGAGPATDGLDASPPLAGYVATSAKPTARTLLTIGDERDPLLATWRAGLGAATAWTSDATARWSAEWVTWERYAAFWAAVVKDTFPARGDAAFALQATTTAEGVRVALTALQAPPEGAEATATVTSPDGETEQVRLDRVALDRFEAVVAASGEGVYAVTARLTRSERDAGPGERSAPGATPGDGSAPFIDTVTTIRSYPQEYAVADADPQTLARAASATGGRVEPDPATAFDAEGLAAGAASTQLWPLLAALALLLAVADVGLRRLRLERADLARAVALVTRRPVRV
ncbi:MAG: VWA domain-containing protein, partial [Euzebyales bacterium]|nr:VWA domain-containing protein [Euzebyales bacterium]